MIPQCFIEYHQNLQKRIGARHKLLRECCAVDGIHDVRVDIKRLRAFYKLVGKVGNGFRVSNQLGAVRRFFKAAGQLRDLHVQMELSRKWAHDNGGNLSEYYNHLLDAECERRPRFSRVCEEFNPKNLSRGLRAVRKSLGKLTESEAIKGTERRLHALTAQVARVSQVVQPTDEDLHRMRIKTKEARYVLELLRLCRPETESDIALNDGLRTSHRALGKWHDYVVSLERLHTFTAGKGASDFFDADSYRRFEEYLVLQRDQSLAEFRLNREKLNAILKAAS